MMRQLEEMMQEDVRLRPDSKRSMLSLPGSVPGGGAARSALSVIIASLALASSVSAQQPRQITLSTPDRTSRAEYNRISSVRELADGSILISDHNDNRLYHLDWSVGTPELIGRVGSGPGEYHRAGRLFALGGDSTLFIDEYLGRWLLLNGAEIVETLAETRRLNQLFGHYVLGVDATGQVLSYVGTSYSTASPRLRNLADSVVFVLVERATGTVDTVAHARGVGSAGYKVSPPSGGMPGRIIGNNPLASEDQALLFVDGWTAVAYVAPYRVDWRAPDGQWLRGSRIATPTIEASNDEKCAAVARMFGGVGVGCEPSDFPGWPSFVPPFGPAQAGYHLPTLLAAPDGNVVIARTPLVTYSGMHYDVIDRSGARVAVVKLPESHRLVGFGAQSAYVVVTDDDGLQQIRRYPWEM